MSTAPAKRDATFFSLLWAPIQLLWQRDKTHILIFIVVNLVAGQIGVITSLALTLQAGGSFFEAYKQNISSGAFYTFAIALVVSSLALIGCEIMDAIRDTKTIRYFESKVVWSILAAAILVIQAPLAGALLSPPQTESKDVGSFSFLWNLNNGKQLDGECQDGKVTIVGRVVPAPELKAKKSSEDCPSGSIESPVDISPQGNNGFLGRSLTQIILWVFSMFIAFQLYCLYRLPLITDRYAAQRNSEVNELLDKAGNQKETSYGEKLD